MWARVDWIHLAQDRFLLAGSFEHGDKAWGYVTGGEILDSRRAAGSFLRSY
jgi:hypothetical protein